MPTSAGEPVTPTNRAISRVLRDIAGVDVAMDEPRMARTEDEDELWRTTEPRTHDIEEQYNQEWPKIRGTEDSRKTRLPTRLDFENAKAHAHQTLNDNEERMARSQLKQPGILPEM